MDPGDQFSIHMSPRKRKRTHSNGTRLTTTTFKDIKTGNLVFATKHANVARGSQQVTWDQNNPTWHAVKKSNKKGNQDIGGHFFSEKRSLEFNDVMPLETKAYRVGGIREHTSGFFFPNSITANMAYNIAQGVYPPVDFDGGISPLVLRAKGATAVSRTLPTDPATSVATVVGELKSGLPSMVGTAFKKHGVKGAGDEYLNYQFGIAPLVSDAVAIQKTYAESEKILAQWYRDSGRRVRRRYSFPREYEETTTVKTGVYPDTAGANPTTYSMKAGTLTTQTTVERRIWFSGSYTYHVPKYADEWMRKTAEFNRLYGVIPNADTAWNLIPWSWLVDWKTNAGDVLKNISYLGKDGLVLTHGYIMCNTVTKVNYTWEGMLARGGTGSSNATTLWRNTQLKASIVTDNKMRLRANPYGIGWTGDTLSGKQLSILAALGISKGKHRIP